MRTKGWLRGRRLATAVLAAVLGTVLVVAGSSAAGGGPDKPGKDLWKHVAGKLPATHDGARAEVTAAGAQGLTLDRSGLEGLLPAASATTVVSLPDPAGGFQRFALQQSDVMAPGLAAQHPEIQTFSGVGLDDATATVHADLSPLGFHASVRSSDGAWYIDPAYHLDDSAYTSYYGRNVEDDANVFVERDADAAELSVDKGYYHADDTVTIRGSGFAADAGVSLTISDPEEQFASRTVAALTDELGSFEATFVADPDGRLETHIVTADDGDSSASSSYQVVRADDPTVDPPTGDVLRTYRLALITDPGYAAFNGGPANVTAAKVALINRVDQVYHDDLSIHLQLIANNDLLNLDTWDKATAPNGPCGAAACFTQSQVTGCSSTTRARFVIGQIVGASNYDIGHLALGQPGGGVANLGVIGRSNKAGGCTGIPTPTGDFYAIDYVAHEMGHQFSGNHPFNGNQLNCSSGNRNASTSVEPGSGTSVMAYAGICLTDDLQPHSDPYFSQRSLQEISTYTSSNQAAINEVQTASLRHFGGGNEVQVVTFGPGYAPTATVQPLTVAIGAAPSTTQRGGAMEVGNTVTIATGATGAVHTLQPGDTVTIAGVANAGYNGTFTVASVPTTRSFTYTNPISGLPVSGGGTVTLAAPGLSESGNTVTVRTAAAHGRSVGDVVTISGAGVTGYNGTFAVTSVPSARSFTYTSPTAGLASSGNGTMTFFSPFQVRIGGNDSAVVGGSGLAYTNANLTSAINAIPGFAGTATVTGAASTGFTITYTGASAGLDVPSVQLANLACGGCFASVEETNHGGANDSFRVAYGANVSAPITNGTNFATDAIQTALQGVTEVQTVSLVGYDGTDSYTLNYNGADTVPITRGQNNTNVGIAAALQGGNEVQAVTLTAFNAANAGNSFQIQIGGSSSATLGNGGLAITNANVAAAVNAIAGFAGTVTATGSGNGGFTLAFQDASAATDVPSIAIVNLGCSPTCSATVRESVKGGPPVAGWPAGGTVTLPTNPTDTGYTLTFGGAHQGTDVSLVTLTNLNGVTGSTAETTKGTAGVIPPGSTASVAGFAGGALNNTGFQVTFGAGLGLTNVPVMLGFQGFTAGASGWVNETDKGGAVDNKGGPGLITPTGNTWPTVTAPAQYTIPLRTPFALTGSATDAQNDPLTYSWEQNDRGAAAGSSLLNNTKTDGPLFSMFPKVGDISATDTLLYNSPGESHLTGNPTRVFPDLQQILDNNTNAETGACPAAPIAPPVANAIKDCYAEFLPTADYVGFANVNANPASLHMRFTVRDGRGGTNSADTTLTLAPGTGPFLVTAPNAAATYPAFSAQTVTWDVAGTDVAPVGAANVRISLSTDGGLTYPYELAASTPNDGSEDVVIPNAATTEARIKVEAVGNVFFDVSNADFTIDSLPRGHFVQGDGDVELGASSGTYAGTPGSKAHFHVDLKYDPDNLKDLDGNLNAHYRSGKTEYEVKTKDWTSLNLGTQAVPGGGTCTGNASPSCWHTAELRSTATLTQPSGKKTVVGSNLTLRVTVTDRGGGKSDSVGITLWDGATLVFSSDWTGSATAERPLKGGKINVH
jgi:hypothetical protein